MADVSTQEMKHEVIEILDSSDDDDDEKDHSENPAFFRRPRRKGDCPICYCEYRPMQGIRLSDCRHTFCQDCFVQYVQTKAQDGEVLPTEMVCPHVSPESSKKCGQALAQRDVLACLEVPADRDRYLRLTLSRVVDKQDNMACCPTAGCVFQFEWDAENRKLECPLCHETYCLVCQTGPWHAGIRCEQFQEQRKATSQAESRSADDDDFQKFAKNQKLKQCPKCKFWVEKLNGCDAMHCRCDLVFCYKCGGCLKGTAEKNGFEVCECGSTPLLQAHEGAPNHNRMDLNRNPVPNPDWFHFMGMVGQQRPNNMAALPYFADGMFGMGGLPRQGGPAPAVGPPFAAFVGAPPPPPPQAAAAVAMQVFPGQGQPLGGPERRRNKRRRT